MNDDRASLDRLHDIIEPPPIPWWPPAPGWYVVVIAVAALLAWLLWRWSKSWRGNAYRRAALRELQKARTPAAVAEVLRRTALDIAPRSTVASLSGEAWPAWLATGLSEEMPQAVRDQLAAGVYRSATEPAELTLLQDYARKWIQGHRLPETADR